MAEQEAPQRKRTGRRAGGRAENLRGKGAAVAQLPWSVPTNPDRPTEPLEEAGVDAIHDGAMRILEEIGIEFLHPEALEILAAAGCEITDENVRMERDFVMAQLALVPATTD